MKRFKKIFIIIIILINVSIFSFAHPGRTDSNGGHYNRKTGEYHYHDGRYAGQTKSTSDEEDNTTDAQSSWEEYKQKKIENSTLKESSDIYLQNKTISNTQVTSQNKIDIWEILGYISLIIFFIFPFISVILSFICEFIKKIFKSKEQETPKTHIYSTDYTVTSDTNKQIKPITYNTINSNYICPKCGGELQLKNGKYGHFIGCKNYPNCRYTKSLKKKG